MLMVSQLCKDVSLHNAERHPALPDRVYLPQSGLNPLKGRVFVTIRERYAMYFRIAAKSVLTDHSIRSQLEDIALVAKTSSKARLLDRHDDWMLALDSSLEVVEKHFKKYQRALNLLELEQDIEEFSLGIHKRAAKRSRVARSAKKSILNLVEDLQNFIHEQ